MEPIAASKFRGNPIFEKTPRAFVGEPTCFFFCALAIYKLHGLLQSFANVQSIRTEKNEIGGQLFNIIIPVDMAIKTERFFNSGLQFWFKKSQKKNLKFIYQGFFSLSLFPFIFDDAARLSLVASFCVKYLKL